MCCTPLLRDMSLITYIKLNLSHPKGSIRKLTIRTHDKLTRVIFWCLTWEENALLHLLPLILIICNNAIINEWGMMGLIEHAKNSTSTATGSICVFTGFSFRPIGLISKAREHIQMKNLFHIAGIRTRTIHIPGGCTVTIKPICYMW